MGSKGSSQPTQTTVTDTKISPELMPYATDVLNQAEALSNQPFVAYGGQQLANVNQNTLNSYAGAANLGNVGQGALGAAGNTLQNAANTAQGLQGQSVNSINAPQLDAYQMQGAGNVQSGSWTSPGVAQSYMNPYETGALQSQYNIANQQFGQQQNEQHSAQVQAGAYGGDRAALQDAASQNNFNLQQQNIAAQGLNTAYTTGQSAFQSDNSANLLSQEANQQTSEATQNTNLQALLNTQQLGSGQNLTAQQSNASNQLQSYQQQLAAAQAAGTLGNSQAALGQTQNSIAGNAINAQYAAGQSAQNYQQQGLNIGYNNFLQQQQYPWQNLNNLSGILNGFNPTPTSSTVTNSSYVNPVTQLVGAGTGLAGIAGALGTSSAGAA